MRILLAFARAHPRRSAATLGCLLLASLAEGIGMSTLLPLLELAAPGDGAEPSSLAMAVRGAVEGVGLEPDLGVLLTVVLAGMLAKAGLVLLANRQVGYAVASVATELRLSLVRALLGARWAYFTRRPVGMIANAFTTEAERASQAFLHGSLVLAAVLQTMLYTGIAFLVSWQATLGAIALGGLSSWALGGLVRASRRAGNRQTELLKTSVSHLSDALHAVKPLRAMAREALLGPLLGREARHLDRALRGEVLSKEGLKALQEPIIVAGLAGGLYVATTSWGIALSSLLMLALLFGRTLASVGKAQKELQKMAARESAYWSLRTTIDEALAEPERPHGGVQPTLERGIEVDGIGLAYGAEKVLADATLFIPAGGLTTLMGASGAGKTSLADLLIGLVHPDRGAIRLDGVDLDEIDLRGWRRMVGYVPQELFLLHESVLVNVTLGDPDLSEEDVWRALERAGARAFVERLEGGLANPVGERGVLLSGGQRQRIAIARAIVREPRFLILDEATASLDPETEEAIVRSVARMRGEMTILAITHQQAFADRADRVYRIQNGTVKQVG
ncbi:MAG: ABC transporter ATP-binding protein [bacterium]|nr:ABC transporter ATP-binding protein [bacterium]